MLVSQIDYNLLSDVVELKETVKQSVDAVMDGKITASHLAIDVQTLLDLLDTLENEWKGAPSEDGSAEAATKQPKSPKKKKKKKGKKK